MYNKKYFQKLANDAYSEAGVFFAFSDIRFAEQLKEKNLKDSEIVSIGAGGFIPKKNYQWLVDKLKEIDQAKQQAKKEDLANRERIILNELHNYEAFFLGYVPDEVFEGFKGICTKAQIIRVFKKHYDAEI